MRAQRMVHHGHLSRDHFSAFACVVLCTITMPLCVLASARRHFNVDSFSCRTPSTASRRSNTSVTNILCAMRLYKEKREQWSHQNTSGVHAVEGTEFPQLFDRDEDDEDVVRSPNSEYVTTWSSGGSMLGSSCESAEEEEDQLVAVGGYGSSRGYNRRTGTDYSRSRRRRSRGNFAISGVNHMRLVQLMQHTLAEPEPDTPATESVLPTSHATASSALFTLTSNLGQRFHGPVQPKLRRYSSPAVMGTDKSGSWPAQTAPPARILPPSRIALFPSPDGKGSTVLDLPPPIVRSPKSKTHSTTFQFLGDFPPTPVAHDALEQDVGLYKSTSSPRLHPARMDRTSAYGRVGTPGGWEDPSQYGSVAAVSRSISAHPTALRIRRNRTHTESYIATPPQPPQPTLEYVPEHTPSPVPTDEEPPTASFASARGHASDASVRSDTITISIRSITIYVVGTMALFTCGGGLLVFLWCRMRKSTPRSLPYTSSNYATRASWSRHHDGHRDHPVITSLKSFSTTHQQQGYPSSACIPLMRSASPSREDGMGKNGLTMPWRRRQPETRSSNQIELGTGSELSTQLSIDELMQSDYVLPNDNLVKKPKRECNTPFNTQNRSFSSQDTHPSQSPRVTESSRALRGTEDTRKKPNAVSKSEPPPARSLGRTPSLIRSREPKDTKPKKKPSPMVLPPQPLHACLGSQNPRGLPILASPYYTKTPVNTPIQNQDLYVGCFTDLPKVHPFLQTQRSGVMNTPGLYPRAASAEATPSVSNAVKQKVVTNHDIVKLLQLQNNPKTDQSPRSTRKQPAKHESYDEVEDGIDLDTDMDTEPDDIISSASISVTGRKPSLGRRTQGPDAKPLTGAVCTTQCDRMSAGEKTLDRTSCSESENNNSFSISILL